MREALQPTPMDLLWSHCLDLLAQDVPEQQFNTWIKPLAAKADSDPSKLVLMVANRFKLDWIRAQYAQQIQSVLDRLSGRAILWS